ncbi:Polysaccharide pyruvyl transferase family protein WcaK [Desulfuromusa kysingii]|uniref:Polysaccharide pyruvyl transferase family protein WcaK n=1 Tax=Desulfuromusa kysingii TaxID=37625 RepID=A0A1H4BB15_9BACT|nr:polysaccharide pyruvyl transferase family protein [Desulfuromusa kysingii]SEA45188.1 Polysaccharide pyruvyl transferase family protein WcaK [Desulfuromusa kysingii]
MIEKSQRKIHIGVFGTYGFENMGDAAVADATIAGLKRHIPNAEIVGICQQPENVALRHHIKAYSIHRVFLTKTQTAGSDGIPVDKVDNHGGSSFKVRIIGFIKTSKFIFRLAKVVQNTLLILSLIVKEIKFSFVVLERVKTLDLMVMSGSGQLNEEWGGAWRYPFGLFRWCLLARLSGCKIAFLSVGAGVIDTFLGKFFCLSALRLAHYRSVRDIRSKKLVESWRVGAVQLVPDMAFSMKFKIDETPTSTDGVFTVGINPISFCDPRTWIVSDQNKYDSYVEKISKFCDWLLSEGYSLVFIPNELVMDNRAIDDILEKIDPLLVDSTRVIRPEIVNYPDVFRSYARCNYVISSRFHGLLFSFMSQLPVIALAHHYKYFELADEMGQKKYCLDIANFNLDELKLLFKDLVVNEKSIKDAIKLNSDNYSGIVENQYMKMRDFVV